MKKLTPLHPSDFEEDVQFFLAVAEAKEDAGLRDRLAALEQTIRNRYARYNELWGNLAPIENSPLSDDQMDDCKSCYALGIARVDALLMRIRAAQHLRERHWCQYCGLAPSNSWDHYLPKGRFGEFSVLGKNIVPCCKDCNTLKSTVWLENGLPRIWNAYFDDWPQERFLFAQVSRADVIDTVPNIELKFSIVKGVLGDNVFARIEKHYAKLELLRRFRENCFKPVGDYLISYRDSSLGDVAIRAELEAELNKCEGRNGWNYCETAMLSALLGSNAFLNIAAMAGRDELKLD